MALARLVCPLFFFYARTKSKPTALLRHYSTSLYLSRNYEVFLHLGSGYGGDGFGLRALYACHG